MSVRAVLKTRKMRNLTFNFSSNALFTNLLKSAMASCASEGLLTVSANLALFRGKLYSGSGDGRPLLLPLLTVLVKLPLLSPLPVSETVAGGSSFVRDASALPGSKVSGPPAEVKDTILLRGGMCIDHTVALINIPQFFFIFGVCLLD